MLTMELPPRPNFSYTKASHLPPRTKKERLAHGCEHRNNKFTGKACKDKKCAADAFCKKTDPPCGSWRAACPVQLIFIKGQPSLRFCKKKNQPGYVVPVNSPEQAQALAKKACGNWKKIKSYKEPNPLKPGKNKIIQPPWPPTYFERKAPEIVEKARHTHPNSPWMKPGLGEAFNFVSILPALGTAVIVAIGIAVLKK
jgi:hypothetical protein